jgi:hypothetical protein
VATAWKSGGLRDRWMETWFLRRFVALAAIVALVVWITRLS